MLVRLLEEGKIRRREKIIKRLKILQGRIERSCEGPCKNLDDDERPFAEDIAVLEPFKSTIFRHTDEDPKCLSMNDLAFAQILIEWHQERRQFILSLLPNDLTEDTGGNKVPDTLALEAVYFRGGCDNAIQYYYHTMCRFRQWQASGEMPGDAPRELCLLNAGDFRRPWNWDRARWSFDSERYTVTTTMLKYLGMDPRTTTPAEFLLDCDLVRLHCILCDTTEPVLHNCWSAVGTLMFCIRGRKYSMNSVPDETRARTSQRCTFSAWRNEVAEGRVVKGREGMHWEAFSRDRLCIPVML